MLEVKLNSNLPLPSEDQSNKRNQTLKRIAICVGVAALSYFAYCYSNYRSTHIFNHRGPVQAEPADGKYPGMSCFTKEDSEVSLLGLVSKTVAKECALPSGNRIVESVTLKSHPFLSETRLEDCQWHDKINVETCFTIQNLGQERILIEESFVGGGFNIRAKRSSCLSPDQSISDFHKKTYEDLTSSRV